MPRFTPNYYVSEKTTTSKPSDFDGMSESDFRKVVDSAAMSNTDRQAAAISKADSLAFHVVHPEFKPTASNVKLMNHWLKSKGLFDNATFPDFEAALADMQNVLDIDKSKAAPRTFVGHFTKREFDSIDALIAQERHAALHQKAPRSDAEIAFENLPTEEALSLLRAAEKHKQAQANAHVTGQNADVWLHMHPEFVDNKRNGELVTMQLVANGCDKSTASVQDFEKAYRQLRESGLLKLDEKELRSQHNEELQERASTALKTPGSIFDETTEEEMANLPLDELRRRANGNFSGV
jgi:hypothetical protein